MHKECSVTNYSIYHWTQLPIKHREANLPSIIASETAFDCVRLLKTILEQQLGHFKRIATETTLHNRTITQQQIEITSLIRQILFFFFSFSIKML